MSRPPMWLPAWLLLALAMLPAAAADSTLTVTMHLADSEWQVIRQEILPSFGPAGFHLRPQRVFPGGGITVAVADVWKVTPLMMLILLAGLQAIPLELYEAARTDGARAGGNSSPSPCRS